MSAGTSSRPQYAGRHGGNILKFYTEEFRAEASPVEAFRQHIIQWFFAAKVLRRFEVDKLTDDPTEEDLASHRMVCSALITFGEFASNFARKQPGELNLNTVALSVDCIDAETRMLRDNFRMFHDNTMTKDQAEDLLKAAFHESK